ncbi:MAG: hypothetical protein IJB57_07225 [Clostridia bacterium]|nr:hypothetical protein [Clostridia bacterium]
MYIYFRAEGQSLKRVDNESVAANSKGFLFAKFDVGLDWDGLALKAVFEQNRKSWSQILVEGICLVPIEVLSAGKFKVWLEGIDSNTVVRATTHSIKVEVLDGPPADNENAPAPTASEIEQLITIASKVRQDADNGVFDGKDGASFEVFSDLDSLKQYPTTTTATAVRFVWAGEDKTEYSNNILGSVVLNKHGIYDAVIVIKEAGHKYFENITEVLEPDILSSMHVGETKPDKDNVEVWVEVTKHSVTTEAGETEYIEGNPINYADALSKIENGVAASWVKDGQYWHPTTAGLSSTSHTMVRTKGAKESLDADEVIRATEGEIYRIYGCFGDGVPANASTYYMGVFVREGGTQARGIISTNANDIKYFPSGELNEDSYFDVQVPSGKEVTAMRLNAYWSSAEKAAEHVKVYKFKEYPTDPTLADPTDPEKNSYFEKEVIAVTPTDGEKTVSSNAVLKYKNHNGEYQPLRSVADEFRKLYRYGTYNKVEKVLPYWFYEPYNPSGEQMPLIVVLHGSLTKQNLKPSLGLGIGENLDFMVKSFNDAEFPRWFYDGDLGHLPAYIVMPQTSGDSFGWASRGEEIIGLINDIKEAFKKNYQSLISEVYIVGYSSGATGAWELAALYPDVFSKIVAVAGGLHGCTDNIKPYVISTSGGGRADLSNYLGEDYSSLSVDGTLMKSRYTTKSGYQTVEDTDEDSLSGKFIDARIEDVASKLKDKKIFVLIGTDDKEVNTYVSTSLYKKITEVEYSGETGQSHSSILKVAKSKIDEIIAFLIGGNNG